MFRIQAGSWTPAPFRDFPRGQGLRSGPLRSKTWHFAFALLSPLSSENAQQINALWRFSLEPFFEINPGILCSQIDDGQKKKALHSEVIAHDSR